MQERLKQYCAGSSNLSILRYEMEVDSRSLDAFTSSPLSGQLCLSVGDLNGCVPGMNTVHQRDVFSGSA